jgi:ABC-2 type transport system ATP-binding protein
VKTAAIELRNLTKVFVKSKKEKTTAVNNVSLSIPKGIIFGLLGPNGAGKSTTIAMICTLLRPTKGTVLIDGVDVNKDLIAARSKIGLVFQESTLDIQLSAYDNLHFQAMMYKIPDKKKKIAEVIKLVGLQGKEHQEVKTYSGGMKRRLEIARALINDPEIVLLDEPTLGLDAASRRELWQYLQKLIEEKHITVLLTTHYLEEAERLCEYIAIMDAGKIVAQGSAEKLISAVAYDTVTVELLKEDKKIAEKLKKKARKVQVDANTVTFTLTDSKTIGSVLETIGPSNISRLEMKKPSLEDAYLHYTGKKYDESDPRGKK